MSWFSQLLVLINQILGKLPGRKEALENEQDAIKKEIHDLQLKVPFTINDAANYQLLLNKLQDIEKRIANLGS